MTNSYTITCCSTADLPASYLTGRDIPRSCFHLRMNGMEYDDDLGKSIPIEGFYEDIEQGAMPITSQVNPKQYETMLESILKEGRDIIHMTSSSGISGTYNLAVIARNETLGHYPDRQIVIIDPCYVSADYGLLVDTAWEMM